MEEAPEVRARLADVVRIRIDVTDDPRADLRDALGLPRSQPYLVFVDDQGEIRRELDLSGRPDGAALLARLDRLGAR